MPPVSVIKITTAGQLAQAYAIRRRVFIEEQRVPEAIELDADDAGAFHVLALAGDEGIGCGRMVTHGHEVKIGRMAVMRDWRGQGVGRQILEFLVAAARAQGCRRAILHAQLRAEEFYTRNGFIRVSEIFEEAGIAHRKMVREL